MASKVIKIIYDQDLFHLPEREQKVKFNAGWLHKLSALNTELILNASEDMKGQIMFLWLGSHLFLILPEGQIGYIPFNWLLFYTFRNWNQLQVLQFSYLDWYLR